MLLGQLHTSEEKSHVDSEFDHTRVQHLDGGPTYRSQRCAGLFEGKLHGPKLATKRVEDQTEAFDCCRAEEWIVALLANDDH
jgi:hypothetical protein